VDFSCDTSQYSAFDESDASSVVETEFISRRQTLLNVGDNNNIDELSEENAVTTSKKGEQIDDDDAVNNMDMLDSVEVNLDKMAEDEWSKLLSEAKKDLKKKTE